MGRRGWFFCFVHAVSYDVGLGIVLACNACGWQCWDFEGECVSVLACGVANIWGVLNNADMVLDNANNPLPADGGIER
jgi:hypothetical protein